MFIKFLNYTLLKFSFHLQDLLKNVFFYTWLVIVGFACIYRYSKFLIDRYSNGKFWFRISVLYVNETKTLRIYFPITIALGWTLCNSRRLVPKSMYNMYASYYLNPSRRAVLSNFPFGQQFINKEIPHRPLVCLLARERRHTNNLLGHVMS